MSKVTCWKSSRMRQMRWVAVCVCTLLLAACSNSDDKGDVPSDDPTNRPPSMPANLTGRVYSDHEIELFWDDAIDDGRVVGYDLYRDDEPIVTKLNANRYFDDSLNAGTRYRYTLYAVDDDAERSSKAEIELETLVMNQPPIINRDNHAELLTEVFALFVGDIYNRDIKNLGFDFLDQYNPDPPPSTTACSNGGTSFFEGSSPLHFKFSNCQVGEKIYDGEISQMQNALRNGIGVSSPGFNMTLQPDTNVFFSGEGRRLYSRSTADYVNVWWVYEWNLRYTDSSGVLEINDANYSFRYGHDSVSLINFMALIKGGFAYRSTLTQNQQVTVNVVEEFQYPYTDGPADKNWNFTSGLLQITAEDGSKLVLNAGTGDDATVQITVKAEGETEDFQQPWSLWQKTLRFPDYFSPLDR